MKEIFKKVIDDLPFCKNQKIILGGFYSQEMIKNELLKLSPNKIIPGDCVLTLPQLAKQILENNDFKIQTPLSLVDRVDVLQLVSSRKKIAEKLPELAKNCRIRGVALKLAKFLTALDRYYLNFEDLDAFIEYYSETKKEVAIFMEILSTLWRQGELFPWSDYEYLRQVLNNNMFLPEGVNYWIIGFQEFTPLEENFLQALSENNQVFLVVPSNCEKHYKTNLKQKSKIQIYTYEDKTQKFYDVLKQDPSKVFKLTHIYIDEIEYITDAILDLKKDGISLNEVGVFVPQDSHYKRFLVERFHQKGIPLFDPTLTDSYLDEPTWIFWQNFLKTITHGFERDDVFLICENFINDAFLSIVGELKVFRGASAWNNFLEQVKNNEILLQKIDKEALQRIEALLLFFKIFSRLLTVKDFYESVLKVKEDLEKLTQKNADILVEFAKHCLNERVYLSNTQGRINKYADLYFEFIKNKIRENSKRSDNGVFVLSYDSAIPVLLKQIFVLSANSIERSELNYDPWEWEGLEARKSYERLHFGLPYRERVQRDFDFLLSRLSYAENFQFWFTNFDISGKPIPLGFLFSELENRFGKFDKKTSITNLDSHPNVPWTVTQDEEVQNPTHGLVENKDLLLKSYQEKISATKLEEYLICPYRFYVNHVLKIKSPSLTESELEVSALDKGSLVHKTLENIIRKEIEQKISLSSLNHKELFEFAKDEASKILTEMSAKSKRSNELFLQTLTRPLKAWANWEYEYRKSMPNFKPYLVEQEVEYEIFLNKNQKYKIIGKVDRVDKSEDGKALIFDYKTGNLSFSSKKIQEGFGVQIIGYALAVQKKFNLRPIGSFYLQLKFSEPMFEFDKDSVIKKASSGVGIFIKELCEPIFYGLNSSKKKGRKDCLMKEEAFEDLLNDDCDNQILTFWSQKIKNLLAGEFSADPIDKNKCKSCAYKNFCGKEIE
jgi:ATP-dependent helicase/DNAse subunit B